MLDAWPPSSPALTGSGVQGVQPLADGRHLQVVAEAHPVHDVLPHPCTCFESEWRVRQNAT